MNKKTSAIIRLTISLLAVVLLTFLLIMGISRRSLFGIGNISFGTKYSNADKYSAGNAKFPADDLKNISINWIDGEVNVLPCDGNDIEIEETSDNNLSEKEKVHYYYDNKGTLYIQYEKSGAGFIFGFINNHMNNKSLTLRIPETLCGNLSNFELDTVSSQNNISSLACSDMDIDSVSGKTILTEVIIDNKLNLDNVSGEVNLQGMFSKLDIDTVSGDCSIDTDITPSSFKLDTVSGKCELKLPYSAEFCAEIDGVSGDMNFDGFKVTKDDDTYICGNRDNEFDFDTVSGDITIIQKEQGIDDSQGGNDSPNNGGSQDGNDNQDNNDSQGSNDNQDNDDSQGGNDSQDNSGSQSNNNSQGYGSQNNNGNYEHSYGHHEEDH